MNASCTVALRAEILTRLARPSWQHTLTLPGDTVRIYEVLIPDGTSTLSLVPAGFPLVTGIVMHCDHAVQVTLGAVETNQPLFLQAGGVVSLLGCLLGAPQALTVTYASGTGTPAHALVALCGERMGWTADFELTLFLDGLTPIWGADFEG